MKVYIIVHKTIVETDYEDKITSDIEDIFLTSDAARDSLVESGYVERTITVGQDTWDQLTIVGAWVGSWVQWVPTHWYEIEEYEVKK